MIPSWEYIAGFFDGDGCIHFRPSSGEYRQGRNNAVLSVSITQNTIEVLELIQARLKQQGIESQITGPFTNSWAQKKGVYHLFITKMRHCLLFIRYAGPFLIVKKQKALEALVYISQRQALTNRNAPKVRRLASWASDVLNSLVKEEI